MKELTTFAVRLRKCRDKALMTQAELAQRIGVDSNTVARWEQSVMEPSLAKLREIAAALGVQPSQLLE